MQEKKQYDDYFEAAAAAKKERLHRREIDKLRDNWIGIAGLVIALAALIVSILK